jgi:hypothetical protein
LVEAAKSITYYVGKRLAAPEKIREEIPAGKQIDIYPKPWYSKYINFLTRGTLCR